MRSDSFHIYGQAEPPAELIPLRAGPLTMLYDPTSGMLRRIKHGDREVLRGIYAAVRDRNWGTVPGLIHETAREAGEQCFRIEFESLHRQGEINFVWRGLIHGAADGRIRFEFAGEAKSTFLRNRIGFCVLHPIAECAGSSARQFRTDGSTIERRFPELIEPQIFGKSSFQQLRSVAHEVSPGVWAEVSFEGDTFEMEDQRNWTDASFKTYCTPLALPFPVEIKEGGRIQQSVELRLDVGQEQAVTALATVGASGADDVTWTIPKSPEGRVPAIGLCVASHGEPLAEGENETLRRLRLSHVRVDVRFSEQDFAVRLEQSVREAGQLGVGLELALHLPKDGTADARQVLNVFARHDATVVRILALREGEPTTSPATLSWVRSHFGKLSVPIGAGSDCNFCELNREHALGRLALRDADFVFWSINPQVHAVDHLSIMETLEAQAATVRSARAFAGNRPLVVSPVTLKQRFNPVATNSRIGSAPGELPPQVDPRQLSQFAAVWTIGSIASLASAGVESVTCYETTGWRGVMERTAGSLLPEKFPSIPGELFPVYHALSELAGFSGMVVVHASLQRELSVLALFGANRPGRVLIANLSATPRRVKIVVPEMLTQSVEVNPYDLARRDFSLRNEM